MTGHNKPRRYYPVFLDITDRTCVVVGGGSVAERKALSLLKAGARVKVVSPELTKRLQRENSLGRIKYLKRRFRKTDLRGAFLVIAATDSEEENTKISAAGDDILVNVVDRPELCNFIVPSTIKRGPLQIAISTSGASPAVAKAIRKELETHYGKELGTYLRRLQRLRGKALKKIKNKKERKKFLEGVVDPALIKLCKRGQI